MREYLKEEIAFIQLRSAIDLFNHNNFISAITLASAAEELFRAFLQHTAKEKNLLIPNRAEIDKALFDFTKDLLGIENYFFHRNQVRNELKHHGGENNMDVVSGDFKLIALMHISGAISNFKLRTGNLPKDEFILDFCNEQGIS